MQQLKIAVIAYCSVWAFMFLLGVLFGCLLRKNVLGNGVKCGMINSFLLSAVWPMTILCGLVGWAYDIWQGWKKL